MTICIAAICENGKQTVVAADRMFTAGPPLNLEFEPPLTKIEKVADGCVAMAAGASLYAAEIIERTRQRIATSGGTNAKPLVIANFAREIYAEFRNEKIEEHILGAQLGPDFARFQARGMSLPAYLQGQPNLFQQLVVLMGQFNLGIDILFAGCSDNCGHIYHLGHPGTLTSLDKLGYTAIGSGGIHAMVALHLGGQAPKASLAATLHAVYDAKIASEVAPGVGQETEMAVISKGDIWACPDSFLEVLSNVRNESIQESKPDLERIRKVYEEQRGATGTPKS